MMLPSNPFVTRAVRPGAIEYLFADGESLPQLMARFEAGGRWGEIIGPHGTGKSTLLATFLNACTEAGYHVVEFELHDGQRSLPVRLSSLENVDAQTIISVDGYEQLSYWSRFWLKRFCRTRSCGLIVTTHTSVGLPELCRTATSMEVAERLIERLQAGENGVVSREEIERSFAKHGGNLREVFFDLYDLCERRRGAE